MKENEKLDKHELWRNIKRSYKYAARYKKNFIIFAGFSVLLAVISAISPLLNAKMLINLQGGFLKQLFVVALAVFSVEIISELASFIAKKNSFRFFRETLRSVQVDLAKETLKIKNKVLDTKSTGVFIDRLSKDTGRITDIFSDMLYVVNDFLTNVGILVAVFMVSKIMFLYFSITIIILFFINRMRIKVFYARDKEYRKLGEEGTGLVTELVRGIRDIKVLNAEKPFMVRVEDKINAINKKRYDMYNVTRIYDLFVGFVWDLANFLLIVLGIILINKNVMSTASLVVIYMYSSRVFNLVYFSTHLLESMKDFNLSANRVFEIIDGGEFEKEEFGTNSMKKIQGNFEFKHVNFSYTDKEVLHDVSFKVAAGTTVSFVGKSGSGKSTIFQLLAKMYDINEGQILIDGIDIKSLDRETIRGNISIINQNPYIFNMSFKDNMRVIKEGVTDEEIVAACKKACIHNYIESLPNGYDTLVGEGGITLSGGQKQRLAIARAFLQDTEIILFDEATSALDNETQKHIQEAIDNLKNEYTILIIAHRLSTVINSDKIYFIDDGKIIDSGTHKELMKKNKEYKKLYELEMEK